MGRAERPRVTTVLRARLRGEPDSGEPAGDPGRPQHTVLSQLLFAQHPLLLAPHGEPLALPAHLLPAQSTLRTAGAPAGRAPLSCLG